MNYFFIDLRGTYNSKSDINDFERKELVNNFVKELDALSKVDNLDNLIISIISNDELEDVMPYINELENILALTSFTPGSHFSNEHIIVNNNVSPHPSTAKAKKILDAIENTETNKLYFADDSIFNQKLTKSLINKINPNIDLVQIVPGSKEIEGMYTSPNKDIQGLNEALENYILSRENVMKL